MHFREVYDDFGTNLRLLRRWFGLLGMATQRAVTHSILHGAASAQPIDVLEPIATVGDLPEA